jgi:hypothetical protein
MPINGGTMLKKPGVAFCCFFLFVAQAPAEEAKNYQIFPLSDRTTECRTNQTRASCVISEVLVLKPNNELAACTASVDIGSRQFQLSAAVPVPSCQPVQCSRCDLIPPISPTENRLELYRTFSYFQPLTIDAAMYWAINQQTGVLTVCAIEPPFAECKTVTP